MGQKKFVNRAFSNNLNGASLEELETLVKKAREAEASGEWKDFTLEDDSHNDEYGSDYARYVLIGKRLETDAEQAAREAIEEKDRVRRAEYEKRQYEALKKKFEGK